MIRDDIKAATIAAMKSGDKAATGAYILHSTLIGARAPKTGAPPGRNTRRVVFGMLRSFRG